MNVFFDVDGTILSVDGSLRPHTRTVFERLIADGHTLYIWSGVGLRTAEMRAAGLEPLVAGIYVKPLYDFAGGLERHRVPVEPDFIIDDYPEIVEHFGGLRIKPYDFPNAADIELLAVPELVAAMVLARSNTVADSGTD